MAKRRSQLVTAFATLFVTVCSCAASPPTVVYSNSASALNQTCGTNGVLFGDEIHLAGTARTVVSFKFEYFLDCDWSAIGNQTVQISFFANDGRLTDRTTPDGSSFPVRAPGTLLYSSRVLSAFPGYNVIELSEASIPVSDTFTWAVIFGGLQPGESGELTIYDPPTVGASASDFWQMIDGAWALCRLPDPSVAVNFAAEVSAITTPAIAIGKTDDGRTTVTVPGLSAPQVLQRSNALQGPWTDWQVVPATNFVGTILNYQDDSTTERTFFRLGNRSAAQK